MYGRFESARRQSERSLGGRRWGGRYRWLICILLFAVTAINYVDRQILGILAQPIEAEIGWSESDYRMPRDHPRLSRAELTYIESDGSSKEVVTSSWRSLLRHRETWGLMAVRFCTDPIWWFYLYWVPKFLHAQYGLTLAELGLPMVTIYVIADLGSIVGGWLSSALIGLGWTTNKARKCVLLLCSLCACPIVLVSQVSDLWVAVALLSLATAGHQGWAANIFTVVSDVYPRHAVSSLVGLSGFGGAVGGMLVAAGTGFILEATGTYFAVFVLAGAAYLIGLAVFQLFLPRLEPVEVAALQPKG
ncbi:MAG: MFS transporter [Luteitalea sp.]|nr:MFS transporter [Luteitalea sp.]